MKTLLIPVLLLCLSACATSPTGRKQLMLVPEELVDSSGAQAFQQLKAQTPSDSDSALNSYVHCVVDPITTAAAGKTDVKNWEVVVFKSDEVNAFALPGGKIGVYTGILPVAKTPGELAAVLGHEVGHVIARHGAERMSTQLATQGGLAAVQAFALGDNADSTQGQLIMAALGVGTTIGLTLPHSRTQESEADIIGENLMARAGFNPEESINLWHNMDAAAGLAPPEWLSDHPANENRIKDLRENMPEAAKLYTQAKAGGQNPQCSVPQEIRLGRQGSEK